MIYSQSPLAIGLFIFFVLFVLGLSFYLARRTNSAEGYYAAGGNIHWFTNGVAFAGDYLSAASILVGLTSSLGLILISPDMWVRYGKLPADAPIQFNSPALISIPLSFLALVIVSLISQRTVSVNANETAGA